MILLANLGFLEKRNLEVYPETSRQWCVSRLRTEMSEFVATRNLYKLI